MTEEKLIQACRERDPNAQKELYNKYSPILFGLCRRYMRSTEDAEDVLVETMYKILTKIDAYEGKGSFEGWMKKIAVNEALMKLR